MLGGFQLGREQVGLFVEPGLPVHGHMDDDVDAAGDGKDLLDGPCKLRDGLGILVAPRAGDDDAAHAAPVGKGDLVVEGLAGDASDDGVGGGEVDPGAGVGQDVADVVGGAQGGVVVGERGDDGAQKGGVGPFPGREAQGVQVAAVGVVQLLDALVEMAVGDWGRRVAKLASGVLDGRGYYTQWEGVHDIRPS